MTAKWPLMDRFWAPELAKQACSWAVNIGDWRCRLLRRMSPLVARLQQHVDRRRCAGLGLDGRRFDRGFRLRSASGEQQVTFALSDLVRGLVVLSLHPRH